MTTPTILTWKPAPGLQTSALRAAGLTTDDVRAAGFRWTKAQRWEAADGTAARGVLAKLIAAPVVGEIAVTEAAGGWQTEPPSAGMLAATQSAEVVPAVTMPPATGGSLEPAAPASALDRALLDAGVIRAQDDNGAAELRRQADSLAKQAHADIARIPGGQPVGSAADANRRERSAEKMRRAGELRDKADAKLEKARETARGQAHRLEQRAEELSRRRETHTPKKLCYAMNAKLDAARAARGAALLRAWAADPSRLPNWRPNAEHAVRARRRVTESVANGWHSYLCEKQEPEPSNDPTILALRAAYPDEAKPDPRAEIDRLEAAVRFSPIPGFFPTPPSLIQRMMDLADIREGMTVLEPSAGNGHLAEAAAAVGAVVECCEIHGTLAAILKAKGFPVVADDCLVHGVKIAPATPYDRILMNPPFERGQDALHIRSMFDLLKPGGRLVAVCSTGPFHREQRNDREFRDWLDEIGAEVEDVEPGAFSGSDAFRKTGVSVKLVVADRRGA